MAYGKWKEKEARYGIRQWRTDEEEGYDGSNAQAGYFQV